MRFGATLIPHAFALWALFLIDRGVLAGLVSAHELGVYSLAGRPRSCAQDVRDYIAQTRR